MAELRTMPLPLDCGSGAAEVTEHRSQSACLRLQSACGVQAACDYSAPRPLVDGVAALSQPHLPHSPLRLPTSAFRPSGVSLVSPLFDRLTKS